MPKSYLVYMMCLTQRRFYLCEKDHWLPLRDQARCFGEAEARYHATRFRPKLNDGWIVGIEELV